MPFFPQKEILGSSSETAGYNSASECRNSGRFEVLQHPLQSQDVDTRACFPKAIPDVWIDALPEMRKTNVAEQHVGAFLMKLIGDDKHEVAA